MFAIKVHFKGSATAPVVMHARRPQALIGASNFANVLLEDMRDLPYQIKLLRALGRDFKLFLVANDIEATRDVSLLGHKEWPNWIEGTYRGSKQLDLGSLQLSIMALDSDFIFKEAEAPDKAGFRILRQAVVSPMPVYPAVAFGKPPVVISFNKNSPVILGRARDCAIRIESPDVSSRHARIGFDDGGFWAEDSGSTNGTFVSGERITSRRAISLGETLIIAKQIVLKLLTSPQELEDFGVLGIDPLVKHEKVKQFPCLVSLSELVKPKRLVLEEGRNLKIGRDPNSDLWLGAPHVSRLHLQVKFNSEKVVSISDLSSNGTEYDGGRLPQNVSLEVRAKPHVIDFGEGLRVALVFTEEQERKFLKSKGALATFGAGFSDALDNGELQILGAAQVKLSDVSQLANARGRQATAHQMMAVYHSSHKLTRVLIWLIAALSFVLVLMVVVLFGISIF